MSFWSNIGKLAVAVTCPPLGAAEAAPTVVKDTKKGFDHSPEWEKIFSFAAPGIALPAMLAQGMSVDQQS